MSDKYLNTWKVMALNLFNGTTISSDLAQVIFYDENYGFEQGTNNFYQWFPKSQFGEESTKLTDAIFKNELMLYFNMTFEQVNIAEINWKRMFKLCFDDFMSEFNFEDAGTDIEKVQNIAYLEWSRSLLSNCALATNLELYPSVHCYKEKIFMNAITPEY